MTTLHWASLEIHQAFSGCATLHEIIQEVEKVSYSKGEVICEIRVNGVLLDESDETKYASSLRETIESLSIKTNRTDILVCDALKSTRDFIPDLETSCVMAAESLRGNSPADENAPAHQSAETSQTLANNEAQRHFGETLKGCQWLVDTLGYIRGAASGINAPVLRTERWFQAEQMIMKTVREMSEAYAGNDSVLVADLLEYELTAALQVWSEVIAIELQRRLEPAEQLAG